MSADTHAALYGGAAELLQRLIRFDSTDPPGNERACVEWIAGVLGDAGLDPRILAKAAPGEISSVHWAVPGRDTAAERVTQRRST